MAQQDQTLLSLTAWCSDVIISQPKTIIGRGESSAVCLTFPHISTVHCELIRSGDGSSLLVKDKSKNGTYLNGLKLMRDRLVELKNGDHLSLTPPGDHNVKAVAYVYRDGKACAEKLSVFQQKIDISDLKPVKLLGKGAFGEVYYGIYGRTERAIKVVRKNNYGPELFQEVKVMDKLRHPNIVGIHEVLDSPDHLIMTMDLANGGDLARLLDNSGPISETDAACMIVQVLNALEYLHSSKVIHRDLKPENILLKNPISPGVAPHLMLTDFGLATLVQANALNRAKTVCGTPNYAAPEIVLADRSIRNGLGVESYDERVDLWSAGILLFRILAGFLPWDRNCSSSNTSLADRILSAANPSTPITMSCPIPVSRSCRHFLESLIVEKNQRLFAKDALKHEWLNETRTSSSSNAEVFMGSQTQAIFEIDMTTTDEVDKVVVLSHKRLRSSVSTEKRNQPMM